MDNFKFSKNCYRNLELNFCNTKKFLTTTLLLTVEVPFSKNYAIEISLLPFILKAGTEKFSTPKIIEEKLNTLYAHDLIVDINNKGKNYFITFELELPTEKLVNNITIEGIDLLLDILLSPIKSNGTFPENSLKHGQMFLINKANLIASNSFLYSYTRLIEEMHRGTSYRPTIRIEDINEICNIDKNIVYKVYEEVLINSKMDFYIIGDIDVESITSYIRRKIDRKFQYVLKDTYSSDIDSISVMENEINIVTDDKNSSHAILLLGIKTNVTPNPLSYMSLKIANAILGKFPASKLFSKIREKYNLCYFINSQLDSEKDHIIISTSISSNDYEKVIPLIHEEIDNLKNGIISTHEVQHAKKSLINLLKESYDNPKGIIDHLIQSKKEKFLTLNEQVHLINNVTVEDIIEVTRRWKIDTIYLSK